MFPLTTYNIGVFITVKKTCLAAHCTVFIIVQIIETLVHEVYEIRNFVAWRFTVLYQLLEPCDVQSDEGKYERGENKTSACHTDLVWREQT